MFFNLFFKLLFISFLCCFSPILFGSFCVENDGFFTVKRVVDGDTFIVENGTKNGDKVRLIGVDAPETRNTARKKIGFYGEESKVFLTKLLINKRVRLVQDVGKRDRYGRILAYVYLGKTFVNAELVKKGYAQAYTVPPNVKYAELFVELEREARNQGRGLWKK